MCTLVLSIFLFSCGCIAQNPFQAEKNASPFIEEVRNSQSYYDNLVIADPSNAKSWCIRGNYYNDAFNQYDKALESYNRSLELDPGYGYAWFSKGITLQNMNRYNESKLCFEKSIQYDPTLASAIPRITGNASNKPENQVVSCNLTGLEGGIKTTRTEHPLNGRMPHMEWNITVAAQDFEPDLKIPAYIPEGFHFQYVSILDYDDQGRVSLVFVNYTHFGNFISTNDSNQMYISFSKNTDVQFMEFIGLEPEPVCINGTPGFYYAAPGRNRIRWIDGDVERWVLGSFDKDTLIRIADSMKLPSAPDLNRDLYMEYNSWNLDASPDGMTVPSTPENPNLK